MTQAVETAKLTDRVGAEVLGVDVDQMLRDEALPAQILEALEADGVLVFRDLHIDDAAQVAFSKRLGRVEVFGTGEFPEIFLVTLDPARNRAAAYLRGTFDWHIDGLTDDIPIMATLLSAHGVADTGGETEFASTYAAYDELTDEEKQRLESIRVVHSIEAAQRRLVPDPSPDQVAMWRRRPAKEQPLIWCHRSGRRSVVLGPTADHVVGMRAEEGQALLGDILARATAPERVYRHVWKVGDMVIWDNRGVLHRALPYDPASPRDMHRTTLHGDEAIA
ncbi:MAG TPA: TauD/TfdA family dioxygenase [Acidimicrobiales bacterium]|nr:TauD/TfdA family dioxygenase [Acidimicrobiales bacterium]